MHVLAALDWGAISQAVIPALQLVLPGLITVLVAGLWKKYGPEISPKMITLVLVPVIGAVQSIVAGLLLDANVWTGFLLSLVGTFFFEFKKQATQPPAQ